MTSKQIRRKIKNTKGDEDGLYYSKSVPNRKIIAGDTKSFGENLNPLERFIAKQVGKKWDKVYSEICKHNSKTGAVGLHIFQHIYGFIEVQVTKDSDGRCYQSDLTYMRWRNPELQFGAIYVDPDDNIIKKYKKNKKSAKKKEEVSRIVISEDRIIEKKDGIWYLFVFTNTPVEILCDSAPGSVIYKSFYCFHKDKRVSPPVLKYAKSKKQLNKAELKLFNVHNDL